MLKRTITSLVSICILLPVLFISGTIALPVAISVISFIALYEIMTKTEGIYGGRFSGAGFKGCCMALIDPAYEQSILERVGREYLEAFPHLEGKYSAHICETADGVKFS